MIFSGYRDYQSPFFPAHDGRTSSLSRYEHAAFQSSSSFNRDLPAILLLLVFLFLIALVFTQILLLYATHPKNHVAETRNVQQEIRQMEQTIEKILKKNAATVDQWKSVFRVQSQTNRFENLLRQNSTANLSTRQKKSPCDEIPANLQGRFLDANTTFVQWTMQAVEREFSHVQLGGRWSPPHCLARHQVAIIIPYRDRFEQLITLLYYLHQILQRQELNYQIFVSEQVGNGTYNKGVLMNAAFLYASTRSHFRCFVFHDVDLIPEDDRNMYSCPEYPRHMSVAVDELHYQLTYEELIGGVLNVPREHFLRVNGYSNLYWGWGAEDDDLYYRIKKSSIKLTRPPARIARYQMLRHTKRTPAKWPKRSRLLRTATKRFHWDGLSSVRYNLTSAKNYRLFTHLLIDVGSPPSGFN